MECKQRLYLTADRKKLVREDHARKAFLYATPGDTIPDSAAEMFGLVDGALPEKGGKSAPTPPNKEKKPGQNKGGGKQGKKPTQPKPPAPPSVPLTDIAGIGEATAAALSKAGIADAAALVDIDAENPPPVEGFDGPLNWADWAAGAKAIIAERAKA